AEEFQKTRLKEMVELSALGIDVKGFLVDLKRRLQVYRSAIAQVQTEILRSGATAELIRKQAEYTAKLWATRFRIALRDFWRMLPAYLMTGMVLLELLPDDSKFKQWLEKHQVISVFIDIGVGAAAWSLGRLLTRWFAPLLAGAGTLLASIGSKVAAFLSGPWGIIALIVGMVTSGLGIATAFLRKKQREVEMDIQQRLESQVRQIEIGLKPEERQQKIQQWVDQLKGKIPSAQEALQEALKNEVEAIFELVEILAGSSKTAIEKTQALVDKLKDLFPDPEKRLKKLKAKRAELDAIWAKIVAGEIPIWPSKITEFKVETQVGELGIITPPATETTAPTPELQKVRDEIEKVNKEIEALEKELGIYREHQKNVEEASASLKGLADDTLKWITTLDDLKGSLSDATNATSGLKKATDDLVTSVFVQTWEDIRALRPPKTKIELAEWKKKVVVNIETLTKDLQEQFSNVFVGVMPDVIRNIFIMPMQRGLREIPKTYRTDMTETEVRIKFLHDLIGSLLLKNIRAFESALRLNEDTIKSLITSAGGRIEDFKKIIQEKLGEMKGKLTPQLLQRIYSSLAEDERKVIDTSVEFITDIIEQYRDAAEYVRMKLGPIDKVVQTYVDRVNVLTRKGIPLAEATRKVADELRQQIADLDDEWSRLKEGVSKVLDVITTSIDDILRLIHRGVGSFTGFLWTRWWESQRMYTVGTPEEFQEFQRTVPSLRIQQLIQRVVRIGREVRKLSGTDLDIIRRLAREGMEEAQQILSVFAEFLNSRWLWKFFDVFYKDLPAGLRETLFTLQSEEEKARQRIQEAYEEAKQNIAPEKYQDLLIYYGAALRAVSKAAKEQPSRVLEIADAFVEDIRAFAERYRAQAVEAGKVQARTGVIHLQNVLYQSLEDIFDPWLEWLRYFRAEQITEAFMENFRDQVTKYKTQISSVFRGTLRTILKETGIFRELAVQQGLFYTPEDVERWYREQIQQRGLKETTKTVIAFRRLIAELQGKSQEEIYALSGDIRAFLQLLFDMMEETQKTARSFSARYQTIIDKLPTDFDTILSLIAQGYTSLEEYILRGIPATIEDLISRPGGAESFAQQYKDMYQHWAGRVGAVYTTIYDLISAIKDGDEQAKRVWENFRNYLETASLFTKIKEFYDQLPDQLRRWLVPDVRSVTQDLLNQYRRVLRQQPVTQEGKKYLRQFIRESIKWLQEGTFKPEELPQIARQLADKLDELANKYRALMLPAKKEVDRSINRLQRFMYTSWEDAFDPIYRRIRQLGLLTPRTYDMYREYMERISARLQDELYDAVVDSLKWLPVHQQEAFKQQIGIFTSLTDVQRYLEQEMERQNKMGARLKRWALDVIATVYKSEEDFVRGSDAITRFLQAVLNMMETVDEQTKSFIEKYEEQIDRATERFQSILSEDILEKVAYGITNWELLFPRQTRPEEIARQILRDVSTTGGQRTAVYADIIARMLGISVADVNITEIARKALEGDTQAQQLLQRAYELYMLQAWAPMLQSFYEVANQAIGRFGLQVTRPAVTFIDKARQIVTQAMDEADEKQKEVLTTYWQDIYPALRDYTYAPIWVQDAILRKIRNDVDKIRRKTDEVQQDLLSLLTPIEAGFYVIFAKLLKLLGKLPEDAQEAANKIRTYTQETEKALQLISDILSRLGADISAFISGIQNIVQGVGYLATGNPVLGALYVILGILQML
ncbi:MAG: hypothetical protein J7L51_01980, partial [Desulfurococcales archaeon]|nr:hypothetical protein [Desulfurococcales archaeon]